MANTLKMTIKRFNGTDWDTFYPASTTSQIASDSTARRYVTDAQLDWLNALAANVSIDVNGILQVVPRANFTGAQLNTSKLVTPLVEADGVSISNNLEFNAGSAFVVYDSTKGLIFIQGEERFAVRNGILDAYGNKLVNLANPVSAQDATTKAYVDGLVAQGTFPVAMVVASTVGSDIALSGLITLDGVALSNGDRVLVKDQTTATQNGIYTAATGAWTKVAADSIKGALVSVLAGLSNKGHQFYFNGTVWLEFYVYDDYVQGAGIVIDGMTIRIASSGVTNDMLAGSVAVTKLANISGIVDTDLWGSIVAANTSQALVAHLTDIKSAIKLLRGTAAWNTDNEQSLTDIYTTATAKNRTYTGSSAPSNSGYVVGDLYFQTAV